MNGCYSDWWIFKHSGFQKIDATENSGPISISVDNRRSMQPSQSGAKFPNQEIKMLSMQNEIDCLHVRIQELHSIVNYLVKTIKRNDGPNNLPSSSSCHTSISMQSISRDNTYPYDINYHTSALQNMFDVNTATPSYIHANQTSSSFALSDDCDSYITTSSKMNPDGGDNGIQNITDMMKTLPTEYHTRFVDQLADTIVQNIRNTCHASASAIPSCSSDVHDFKTIIPDQQLFSVSVWNNDEESIVSTCQRNHSADTSAASSVQAQEIMCHEDNDSSHLTSSLLQQQNTKVINGSCSSKTPKSTISITRSFSRTVSCLSSRIVQAVHMRPKKM